MLFDILPISARINISIAGLILIVASPLKILKYYRKDWESNLLILNPLGINRANTKIFFLCSSALAKGKI